ncbi:hypothetical protein [Methanococcus voltae]|uniref:Uncharacterized protein n=1 Tax=Methanococcus voltae (strain ATCC BAA-1334 / A3) TaxID=456320 RepID=D7DV79_METV3|nr:hypothetical protein [Methanococcus voltae]MCS3901918.1 hypothetical protein [Methanococcus voltae]
MKKRPSLYIKIHYPGSVLEGDFDFEAVVNLKDKYLKYLDTGKHKGTVLFNEDTKKFVIVNFKEVCAIEVDKTLIFMDEYEREWDKVSKYKYEL